MKTLHNAHVKPNPFARLPCLARKNHPRSNGHASMDTVCGKQYGNFSPVSKPGGCLRQYKGNVKDVGDRTCVLQAIAAPEAATVASTATITKLFAIFVGYCVVVGSFFRSIPQIARVLKNKSGDGISVTAIFSELFAFTISMAYNIRNDYPFSSFGDIVSCWVQDVVLLVALCRFQSNLNKRFVFSSCIALVLSSVFLTSGQCPLNILWALQASTILIIILGGKLPQIIMNIKRGDSGELSIITSGLNVAGGVARLFTTLILTKDVLNFFGSLVMLIMNVVLLHQTLVTAGVYGPNAGKFQSSPA